MSEEPKELATVTSQSSMPAYLREKQVDALPEGFDASDLIIPRMKLLQSTNEEVTTFDNAKIGIFWHNVLNEGLGTEVEFVVASYRKKFLLMAPMNDPRGVLARAEDAVHWSPPNASFEVKLKNIKEPQIWKTKPTVAESGLDKFGSSVAGDEDSKPAAVLIYEFMIYLRQFPQYSPIIMSLARSQAKRGKDLISKITYRGAALSGMAFKAVVTDEVGDEGPYKNVSFQNDGWATEEEYNRVEKIKDQFGTYRVADEEGAVRETERAEAGAENKEF